MSPKRSTSPSTTIDSHCQHISPKGNRCHRLIDVTHNPANGAKHPNPCAYHANRLRAAVPIVEPEVLAAELVGEIDDFSTAGSVNLFLGNLFKQLARKRIASLLWRDSWTPSKKPRRTRRLLASTPAFANKTVNL